MKLSIDTTIMNFLAKDLSLDKNDQDKLLYSLRVIIGDLSKLVLLYLVFLFFNHASDYLMALLALSIIRIYSGGLHFKTYAGCLLFTFSFFSASILLTNLIVLPRPGLMILGFICLLVIALISPITSKSRPDYNPKTRLQFKLIGCTAVALHLIGFMATKNNPYFTLSVWVIFLQCIQLMIAKGVENREKKIQF